MAASAAPRLPNSQTPETSHSLTPFSQTPKLFPAFRAPLLRRAQVVAAGRAAGDTVIRQRPPKATTDSLLETQNDKPTGQPRDSDGQPTDRPAPVSGDTETAHGELKPHLRCHDPRRHQPIPPMPAALGKRQRQCTRRASAVGKRSSSGNSCSMIIPFLAGTVAPRSDLPSQAKPDHRPT